MAKTPIRCLLVSDFNVGNLRGLLSNDTQSPAVAAESAPFGQVSDLLVDPSHECWNPAPDAVLAWTQPQGVIRGYARLLEFEAVSPEALLAEVDQYCAQLAALAGRVRSVFVPTWVAPPHQRGLGLIDLAHERGQAGALLRMNARLVDNLRGTKGVFLLDAQRWIANAGKSAYNARLWHMAKVPFSNSVFAEAIADLKAAFSALAGQSRKLLLLDLDDTLWGGIVGDLGWEKLKLGGHDPIGESFVEFQRALKALKQRGIVLGLVSKNEESVALNAIRSHPDMQLRIDDFAGWRINWEDKARNIAELVEELNLGLQSVVFIDDNPVERDRVRAALPEVLVPDWPGDKMLYAQALSQLRCFDLAAISQEDQARTQMYVADRARRDLAQSLESVDDWFKKLEIRISIESLTQANLTRAAQLLNKTNQMNLATRRLAAEQLWDWAKEPGQRLWTLRVADKFGDSGLVGIVSIACADGRAELRDFILSCRVFGRRVEEAMLHVAASHARALGMRTLEAHYAPTAKNKPTLAFLERSGLESMGEHAYAWDLGREYPAPQLVALELPQVPVAGS
ncbi:MAG: HAD-IIIC family phosphatase [Planctomycetes bacterium]|nr:HAD-IIIC family phosphatase [Planctomycetota bacterium]